MNLNSTEVEALIASPDPLPTLFHYTTQDGLLGILNSNSLWASKLHYLNDSAEFQLALELGRHILKKHLEQTVSVRGREKLECLLHEIPTIRNVNVCVASFSAASNLLSQWRAYGGPSGGFAIGFRSASISKQAQEHGWYLGKCIYKEEEQYRRVDELVEQTLASDFNTEPLRRDPTRPRTVLARPIGGDFAVSLTRIAPFFKHASFHEKEEWRLVSRPKMVKHLSFRPGASMLTPYTSFPLAKVKAEYLASVTVGPTPHLELSKDAVTMLLAHYGDAQDSTVFTSGIPYRKW